MALIWADGFGHWGTKAQMLSAGYQMDGGINGGDIRLTKNAADARTGDWYLGIGGGYNSRVYYNLNNFKIATVGFAVKWENLGGLDQYCPTCFLNTADGKGLSIAYLSNGSIQVRNYQNGAVLDQTPVTKYGPGTFNYFEIQIDMIAKTWTIRMNNIVILTGVNDFGTGALVQFRWGGYDNSNYMERGWHWVNDFYVTRGDVPGPNPGFLGDVRCRTIFPNADGPLQQWDTVGAASAVAALDNVPFVAGEYIASDAVGDQSNFQMQDIPANTAYVAAVVLFPAIAKTDAGLCEVTPQVTSNGVTADLTPVVPAVAAAYYPRVSETNPDTGLYWTKETVNSMTLGFKRSA